MLSGTGPVFAGVLVSGSCCVILPGVHDACLTPRRPLTQENTKPWPTVAVGSDGARSTVSKNREPSHGVGAVCLYEQPAGEVTRRIGSGVLC